MMPNGLIKYSEISDAASVPWTSPQLAYLVNTEIQELVLVVFVETMVLVH